MVTASLSSVTAWRMANIDQDRLLGVFGSLAKPESGDQYDLQPDADLACPLDLTHRPPEFGCTCGLYACLDPAELRNYAILCEFDTPAGYDVRPDLIPVLLRGTLTTPMRAKGRPGGGQLVKLWSDGSTGEEQPLASLSNMLGSLFGASKVLVGYGMRGDPPSTVRGAAFTPDLAIVDRRAVPFGRLSHTQQGALPVPVTYVNESLTELLEHFDSSAFPRPGGGS